jgi:hypothetical protein
MIENAGRRASTRVGVRIPVRYVQTGGAQGDSEITQLSAGGCIISATGLDPRGPDVFLHFCLGKDNVEIHLRARVIHVEEGKGTGLEFGLVSPEGRELLRQQVAESSAGNNPSS